MGNLHQEPRVTKRLSSRSSKKKKEWRKKCETHRSRSKHGHTFTVEARSHVHGRSTVTVMVKEEEGVEEEMFNTLSSFVGTLRLIFEFSNTFQQLEVLK